MVCSQSSLSLPSFYLLFSSQTIRKPAALKLTIDKTATALNPKIATMPACETCDRNLGTRACYLCTDKKRVGGGRNGMQEHCRVWHAFCDLCKVDVSEKEGMKRHLEVKPWAGEHPQCKSCKSEARLETHEMEECMGGETRSGF